MQFCEEDARTLEQILFHRRDVRGNRFLSKDIPEKDIKRILNAGIMAPSVGYSQPWEFIIVDDPTIKKEVYQSFLSENNKAKEIFKEEKNEFYSKLKLEGILEAPINLAIFYREKPKPVLGQTTIKQSGEYSVVCAVQNIWLMARALNIGVGWVSILNPETIHRILKAPRELKLVAYLCIGFVENFLDQPELELLGWDKRKNLDSCLHSNQYLD